MSDSRTLVLALAGLALASSGSAATKKRAIEPESLIVKARSKEILWTEGTPKLAVRGEIEVATQYGGAVASMKVGAVGDFGDEAALFSVPANGEFWARCNDMPTAMWLEPGRTMPVYPMAAMANHEQGTVVFYAVVEADGSVSHLTPIQIAAPDLVAAAADAVRTWRYKPAICDGKPIRCETQITVVFRR